MIPERHRDELEDEPPDDERADERRAARHDRDKPAKGWAPVTAADFESPKRAPLVKVSAKSAKRPPLRRLP